MDNYERVIKNEEETNVEVFQNELNQNNKDFINQDDVNNDQPEEIEEDDDRLTYTLITLDLGNLIHIFEDNNISFVDMLLLSKEDLIELQLEIYQRNRILNFSKLFTKYAKNYSIREISDFFTFNKQFIFNSSIYDKVFSNNKNIYENEIDNDNYDLDNNEQLNQENNYINTNQNLNDNQNNNNLLTKSMTNNPNNSNLQFNSQGIFPKKIKEPKSKTQNINGAAKKIKNSSIKNSNININEVNQQNNFHNKLLDLIKKRKTSKNTNLNLGERNDNIKNNLNQNQNEIKKNDEFQKIIEKIGYLEDNEMNYDLYTKLNLIKTYINNKGDKITLEDIMSINNDIDKMIETTVVNSNLNKKNYKLNNKDCNKKENKIKVAKKQ
jgi:hypothetical protein